MTKKINKMIVAVLVFSIASVFSTVYGNEIFAEHEERSYGQTADKTANSTEEPWRVPSKMSVNDIMIKVQVQNIDGQMEYDSFTSFTQTSGFRQNSETPEFKLEGLVGPEKHHLYEMADNYYRIGQNQPLHNYDKNKFIISLEYDGIPVRSFEYTNCDVTNYYVETLNDGIFTYQEDQGVGVAFVDQFEFACDGYIPHNNYYAMKEKQDMQKLHHLLDDKELK